MVYVVKNINSFISNKLGRSANSQNANFNLVLIETVDEAWMPTHIMFVRQTNGNDAHQLTFLLTLLVRLYQTRISICFELFSDTSI